MPAPAWLSCGSGASRSCQRSRAHLRVRSRSGGQGRGASETESLKTKVGVAADPHRSWSRMASQALVGWNDDGGFMNTRGARTEVVGSTRAHDRISQASHAPDTRGPSEAAGHGEQGRHSTGANSSSASDGQGHPFHKKTFCREDPVLDAQLEPPRRSRAEAPLDDRRMDIASAHHL